MDQYFDLFLGLFWVYKDLTFKLVTPLNQHYLGDQQMLQLSFSEYCWISDNVEC